MLCKLFVVFALCLLVNGVAAIHHSQLNYSDPELLTKLINGSIVVDIPPEHKRQSTTIADIYIDTNLNSYYISITTGTPGLMLSGIFGGSTGFGVSSVHLVDDNYMLVLWSSLGCQPPAGGGSYQVRYFRTLYPINKLADQDNFNDQTQCAQAIYMGPRVNGATLFEDSNFGARATYILPNSVPVIPTTPNSSMYPPILRANKLSSMEIYPGVQIRMWANQNYGGQASGYWPTAVIPYMSPVASVTSIGFCNDCLDSYILA